MTIEELKKSGTILFEVISGSKAFGLDTPTSDTDIKGVFYMPKDKFFGLGYIPQISNETYDIVYYELGRFIELLLKNNPNILEILATDSKSILYKNSLMDKLKLDDFLSKLCKETFAGYAMSQIKKARGLKKKIVNPMDKERKRILDFCVILKEHSSIPLTKWLAENNYNQDRCGLIQIPHSRGMYTLFYDEKNELNYKGIENKENSNDVSISSIPKGEKTQAYLSFNLEGYSTYCKDYREYWEWIEKRNDKRYQTNMNHGQNYDSKNMMHTIRLLESAERIFKESKLEVSVTNSEELLAIKRGELDYEVLITKAESILNSIENLAIISSLPEMPDYNKAEETLIAIRKELYN